MTVPSRKIPRVARLEFGNLRLAIGRNHRRTATSGEDVSPLGGKRVPMQLADRARLQTHGDASDALRYGKLRHGGFLSRACFAHPAFLIFDIEFEVVQLLRMGLFGGRCL